MTHRTTRGLIRTLTLTVLFIASFFAVKVSADSSLGEGTQEYGGRKIVSMVYDDSGSMQGAKEAYSNYTFQLFLSMFSEDDSLFITFMSNPSKAVDFSVGTGTSRQAVIDRLRDHSGTSYTPITTVENAFKKLLSVTNTTVSDEYWLIVLTDGAFQNGQGQSLPGFNINSYFKSYQDNLMPNGTPVRIVFIGIGDDVPVPRADEENYLFSFSVSGASDIRSILDECSILLSNVLKASDSVQMSMTKQENLLHFYTPIPLTEMIVITDDASVITASVNDQGALELKEILDVYYYNLGFDETLTGNVTYIADFGDYLLGQIDIAFNTVLDENMVTIYVKPAIELRVDLTDADGKAVEKIQNYRVGDTFDAKLSLYRLDNGEKLDPRMLSSNVNYTTSVRTGTNNAVASVDEDHIEQITITKEGLIYDGTMNFGRYFEVRNTRAIDVYETVYELGDHYTYDRTKVNKTGTDIQLQITKNTKPQDYTSIVGYMIRMDYPHAHSMYKIDYSTSYAGTVLIRPVFGDGKWYNTLFTDWLSVWMIRHGDITLTTQLKKVSADIVLKDEVTITNNYGTLWLEMIYYFYPFFWIFLVFGFIFKKRFVRNDRIMFVKLKEEENDLVLPQGGWHRMRLVRKRRRFLPSYTGVCSFIPYITNMKERGPVKCRATVYFKKTKTPIEIYTRGCVVFKVSRNALDENINKVEYIPAESMTVLKRKNWTRVFPYEVIVLFKDDEWYAVRMYRSFKNS